MALTYYNARSSLIQAPSSDFKDDYQQFVDYAFEASSSYYNIEEEITFGTQTYSSVEVRINHAINSDTGANLGDDFRKLIFKDFSHARGLGFRYRFDNNIWLCMNSDLYKYTTASTTVRRCNNVLRWVDENGAIQTEPCVIDYTLTDDGNDQSKTIIPDGLIKVTVQNNDFTKNIKLNQRFMFNKDQVFKVQSKINFLNNATFDDNPPTFTFKMFKDQKNNATDNSVLSIADYYSSNYTIEIEQNDFSGSLNSSGVLSAVVKKDGVVENIPIEWSSSDITKATINPTTGSYNLIALGNIVITATIKDNVISDSINIAIVNSAPSVKTNEINPLTNKILQGREVTYSVNGYTNGVLNSDTFTVVGSGVPNTYYNLQVINGNSFKVTNLKMNNTPLTITCTNNVDSTTITLDIKLSGLY